MEKNVRGGYQATPHPYFCFRTHCNVKNCRPYILEQELAYTLDNESNFKMKCKQEIRKNHHIPSFLIANLILLGQSGKFTLGKTGLTKDAQIKINQLQEI